MRNCFFMTYFSIATQFQWFQLKYIQPWSVYGQCNQPYHCYSHFILPNELKRGIWFQLTNKWIVTVRFFRFVSEKYDTSSFSLKLRSLNKLLKQFIKTISRWYFSSQNELHFIICFNTSMM